MHRIAQQQPLADPAAVKNVFDSWRNVLKRHACGEMEGQIFREGFHGKVSQINDMVFDRVTLSAIHSEAKPPAGHVSHNPVDSGINLALLTASGSSRRIGSPA